ncbi:flagellar basal body-associated protein FliL [Polynucleobacter sp. Adler-ghost]|uniref:flagellar basal body-associated FliL family protein n=1 Tax=Polynucleobacter sp. Adler-ghost TaxID=2770234 RepID=UPI001BFCFCA3|nr:flagellar basal body-associated FliL family protein [Polynucleobacter sp. Adler-ghost]QWE31176.1 flagellar basal body-associated FliL family protein [Polynucleobacter sp. Adler-ghost]
MADEERVEPTLDVNGGIPPPPVVEQEEVEEEKPKSKKMLFLIIGLIVVLAGAVGGYLYMQHNAELKRQQEAEDKRPENILKKQLMERKDNAAPIYIALDEMIVNLPGRGGEHYLQTKMVLRTNDGSTEDKIKKFMPVIRDKVITVLSSRQMQELATVEGKTMMAREVALVINSIIAPQLTAIYILQQQPSTADIQNLERIGAVPKETSSGQKITGEAARAAAEFWNVTEMDLPVQAVLFNTFVMQ